MPRCGGQHLGFAYGPEISLEERNSIRAGGGRTPGVGAGPIASMWKNLKGWQRVTLWLVLFKIGYLCLIWGAARLWPSFDEGAFDSVKARWPRQGSPVFGSHFATWDGAHYLYLSEVGYAKDVPSCAFYPLWPLAIRWFSVLTGGSHLAAGLVLANALSLTGWILFYQNVARRFGEPIALCSLVLMVAFPGSLFYQFIYSEPLFLLLLMLLWFALERGSYRMAWAAAFLLPLTRGIGVFCVLPIGWHWLMRRPWGWLDRWHWLNEERKRSTGGIQKERLSCMISRPGPPNADQGERMSNNSLTSCLSLSEGAAMPKAHQWEGWKGLALVLAPPLGFILYFCLMWLWTGNPFEGLEAQKYWRVHSISNLWNVPKFVTGFFSPEDWHQFRGSVLDRCSFLVLVYSLPLIWRLGKDMVVWTYVLGVLPAMSGTFVSFTRFESIAFPMFIALAMFFVGIKRKWPLVAFLALSASLHAVLVWRFVNFRWAG